MINKDGEGGFLDVLEGHNCYEGRHIAHGGLPSPSPTRENSKHTWTWPKHFRGESEGPRDAETHG